MCLEIEKAAKYTIKYYQSYKINAHNYTVIRNQNVHLRQQKQILKSLFMLNLYRM